MKGSKSPNAAKLLAEYTLSLEAQKLWPESGIYAARFDVEPPPESPKIGDVKVIPMDYAYITSATAQVKKKLSEIFSIRLRAQRIRIIGNGFATNTDFVVTTALSTSWPGLSWLVPAIHVLLAAVKQSKTWMPGIKPGMTE